MIKKLIKLANHLDAKGLSKEADYLDGIIIKMSSGLPGHVINFAERVEDFIHMPKRIEAPQTWEEYVQDKDGQPGGQAVYEAWLHAVVSGNLGDSTEDYLSFVNWWRGQTDADGRGPDKVEATNMLNHIANTVPEEPQQTAPVTRPPPSEDIDLRRRDETMRGAAFP